MFCNTGKYKLSGLCNICTFVILLTKGEGREGQELGDLFPQLALPEDLCFLYIEQGFHQSFNDKM